VDNPQDKNFWILTKDEYFALVDQRMASIGKTLKQRWINGEIKKGRCDLLSRDFIKEGREELMDETAYDIIEEEKQRRRKIAEGWAP
jgi:hypothetical protein